jgi:predicted enzyme related to lactoylglutathione lyase
MEVPMSKFVANIGGVFLNSVEPVALADWYQQALDIEFSNPESTDFYYTVFKYDSEKDHKLTGTVFSIFKVDEVSAIKTARVNYRVKNLDEVLQHLKANNITVDKVEEHPEGKFAWLNDPDNNQVELWQDTRLD